MKKLSIVADVAWRIAAHEAASSGYRYLEKEHLLIGILSIEKVLADGPEQAGIDRVAWNNLKAEYSALRKVCVLRVLIKQS